MNLRIPSAAKPQAGYTLLTTLVLTGAITAMLAATLSRTMTNAKLNDRNNAWQSANAAAEAATEKVLSRMMVDFANGGETSLSNNLSTYRATLPTTSENSFWTNFLFSDGNGHNNAMYISRTTTTPNPPYVMLEQQYPGLSAFAATYRILSNADFTNNNYNITGAVQQDVQMAEIPVFQFAVFYNTLLEFSDCATMTVNGRVHCNTNINVGCTSSATLTFNYFVDCTGYITNPGAGGVSSGSWVASHITYNGTPSPGYGTGEPVLTLPVGTNSLDPNAVREIINPPPSGESQTNPISSQRFYNKADMIIIITNAYAPVLTNQLVLVTNTNSVLTTNAVFITIKSSMYDTGNTYAVTNGLSGMTNGTNYSLQFANWAMNGFTNWLSLTNTFYDQRQSSYQHVVQIDVGKLGTWIGNSSGTTNTLLTGKWNSTTPFNGIIYIQDNRTTNAAWDNCIRLVDGQNITNGLYTYGLTVATQNPLYIMGLYNCPAGTNVSATNTGGCRPCSVICDALTILSPNWQTGGSGTGYDSTNYSAASYTSRPASANDTVNTAIMTGNVLTTDTSATGFSGGVHNLTRLLEDWGSSSLWLNSSIICLYTSAQATAQFQMPNHYYAAPTRHFSFDLNYQTSTGLPPGTPLIDRMIRADWAIAPPSDVTYTNPTLSFVPH